MLKFEEIKELASDILYSQLVFNGMSPVSILVVELEAVTKNTSVSSHRDVSFGHSRYSALTGKLVSFEQR